MSTATDERAVSPVVTYHCASASASPFPPDCPAFAFADAPILRRRDDEEFPSESFTFVLTDSNGDRTYGYTRRFLPVGSVPRYPEALCILSTHAFPALFGELLEHLQIRWLLQPGAAFAMVEAALAAPLPRPGQCWPMAISSVGNATAAVGAGKLVEQFVLARAEDSLSSAWPLLPISRYLSLDNLLLLLSALLCEQRIVFVSKHLSRLSDCIHAAVALLTPLQWQHILVPLLPRHLLNYCCAPMPFLIGLLDDYLVDLLAMPGLDEIVVVNLDANRVSTTRDVNTQARTIEPGEEIKPGRFAFPLPDEIAAKLKKQLKTKDYGAAVLAASASSTAAASVSSSDSLQEQDFFEAALVFQMQLFASVDWSAPLDSRGKFVVDDFVAHAEQRCPQGHWFLEQIKHSQCVERFLQLGSERNAAGRAIGNTSGTTMSYAERFERMRQEVVTAASSSTPEKPYADLFSFSFVLKRIHAHLETAAAAQSAQAAQAVAQAVGSSLPRFLGESETRKLALELTSNSPMSKQRSPADVLASFTAASFDSRTLNAILPVVWERLSDARKKNFAHGHKGLILLEHLLHHGSDRVIVATLYAMQPQITLQSMAHTYTHETLRTQDLIRSCAGRIQTLLGNVFLLRKTRRYLRVCDLRRYRWMGALAGSAAHNKVSITLGPEMFDPEYDEFRQRSLVEMMLPALPPFNQLHARYTREFASPPAMATPASLQRGNSSVGSPGSAASPETPDTQTAAQLSAADFAAFAWDDPASAATATTVAPPSTVAATRMMDNFDFSGAAAAASGAQPQTVLAILPPAAATAAVAPANSASAFVQPPVSRSQSGTPVRPAAVHASIIDTSIFESVAPVPAVAANQSTPVKKPAATAAAAVSGSKPSPSAAPPRQLAAYASAPAPATTAAAAAAPAASTASASPWAAFDDAFSDPAPAASTAPAAAALSKAPSQSSATTPSPARSHASTPALAPAAVVPAPAAAPALSSSVDPTAGLDLFFFTPAPVAAPAAPVAAVCAPSALASIGGVAAPVMTPEEIEKQRLRREKKAAKQAEGREAAAAAAAAAAKS